MQFRLVKTTASEQGDDPLIKSRSQLVHTHESRHRACELVDFPNEFRFHSCTLEGSPECVRVYGSTHTHPGETTSRSVGENQISPSRRSLLCLPHLHLPVHDRAAQRSSRQLAPEHETPDRAVQPEARIATGQSETSGMVALPMMAPSSESRDIFSYSSYSTSSLATACRRSTEDAAKAAR